MTYDDKEEGYGSRKTSEDKLNYRFEIQNAIHTCRIDKGTLRFPDSVEGLIDLIYFDVKGYTLRTKINRIRYDLSVETKLHTLYFIRKNGTDSADTAIRLRFKTKQHQWYYNELFNRIIQLLAEEKLLFETEKIISWGND